MQQSAPYLATACCPYPAQRKAAKDTASAGVLMMAIISTIAGLIIFVPKIIDFIGGLL